MTNDRYLDGENWKWKQRPDVPRSQTTKPNAPTNLAASNITGTNATLTWTLSTSPAIVEQRIYRNNTLFVTVGPTDTTYTITDHTSGTTYNYKVTAYNGTENSGFSIGVNVTATEPTTPTPPGQVTGVDAVATGQTTGSVSWVAPATGGAPTGYRVFLNGSQYGGDLGSTVRNATLTNLTAQTTYSVTVRAFNADGVGALSAADSFTTEAPTTTTGALFAGHTPGRSYVGVSTSDGSAVGPGLDEQIDLLGVPIYAYREFVGGQPTLSNGRSMLNEADSVNSYAIVSWKPGTWSRVFGGLEDAQLQVIYDLAVERRNQGKRPFAVALHHEPAGDTQGTLAEWAKMNEYCSWWFGGRRGGTATSTYNAANDVRDIMTFTGIGNGFWWRTSSMWTPTGSDANVAWPAATLNAFRVNGGVILNDFYDADYINQSGAMTDPSLRHPGNGVRTSVRLTNFMNWYNQKVPNRDIAVGAGEIGCINGAEMQNCWKVIRQNRDVWALTMLFSSMANSDHDWRAIPNNYPVSSPVYVSSKGLRDFGGGNPSGVDSSGTRLTYFVRMLQQSNSVQYGGTGPNYADL